jgi:hypothetical protein
METGDIYNECLQLKKDIQLLISKCQEKLQGEAVLFVTIETTDIKTMAGKVVIYKTDVQAVIKPD